MFVYVIFIIDLWLLHIRWLGYCLENSSIIELPLETLEWVDPMDEYSMFSPSLVERGITAWECAHCPWWLEYPLGVVPKSEQQMHARK